MKKLLPLLSIIALTFLASNLFAQYSNVYYEQKKEDYQEFIKNHDYSQTPHYTNEELKVIPKNDRPDLAHELNFLQTLDPISGVIPPYALIQAHKITDIYQAQNKTAIPGIVWTERGPDNIGGRTRAMIFDPNDATGKTVIAGGVAGGIWINTDITSSSSPWTAVNNFWDNLAVTALAYHPTTTTIMYAGTGEGYSNIDAVRGGGIWKSTNGGSSWSHLGSTSTYGYITRIAVKSNGEVYASTKFNGIIRSTNGGTSWSTVLSSSIGGASTSRAADIKVGTDGTLYAGMGIFSTDGIYTSSNGTTWTKRNTGGSGFPTGGIRRIEIGCAPSNANVVYAIVQNSGNGIEGIYKSTNKGINWTSLTLPNDDDPGVQPDFTRNAQAWYDLSIAIDPNDANTLFVGGIDLFKSTNAGTSWSQVSHWYGGFGHQEVHADQHGAVYLPGSSSKIIFGNDGGVYYSSNANTGSPTISVRNNGYNVTQYYAAAINGTSGSNNMIAGAQDNGTQKYTTAGINSTFDVTGGDGAFSHIDQSNGNNQIGQYVYNVVRRTTNNWGSQTTISNSQSTGLFINPSDYDDKEDIYYSGHADGGVLRLKRISNPFGSISTGTVIIATASGDISHISASPYSSAGNSTLFVGSNGGNVYKVTNAQGGSPTVTNIGSALPSGNISCIAIGATEQQLLVTLSNYNTVSVWETTNGGTNWTSKEGNLPNMPVRWGLYNPLDYNQVFLATEVGVWTTDDLAAGSVDWSPTNTGLANVRTDMLQYRSSDRTIVAATHGRGLFTTVIPVASPPVAEFSGTPTTLCEGNTVSFTDLSTNTPTGWLWSFPGGTPNSSTSQNPTITYNTAGTYDVTLTASNASGNDIETKVGYITVTAVPGTAGAITGSTSECENATGIPYSISAVAGSTNYTWGVPAGAIVVTGQGTTNITVNFGTTSGNVSVTPSNSCGNGGSSVKAVTINVCGAAPVAEFSGTPTTLCEGNTVSFTDLSTNTPTGWLWSFPGGTPNSSTAQNPLITYNTAGTYAVTLTASNAFGNDPETKIGYITVNSCGTTQLRSSDCGLVMTSYLNYVMCDYVPGASEYEYEFVNISLAYNQTYLRPNVTYRFVYVNNVIGIQNGTTYDVRVRAKVGGVWSNYGPVCQLTTPGSSITTQLRSSDCGLVMPSYANYITCDYVFTATEYEYEFVNTSLAYNQTYLRTNPTYRFAYVNNVPGIQLNTTYDVRVRAKIGGVFTNYGAVCQITTPVTPRIEAPPGDEIEDITGIDNKTINNLQMTVYPNPSQGEFVYIELQGLSRNSEIIVTDIFGKTILNQSINSGSETYSGTLRFNQKLSSGFYLITVISDNQKTTKKLIVR